MVAEIILVTTGAQPDALRQDAQYVARNLAAIGHRVREQISVCENQKQLGQAVSTALGRSQILMLLGGLGKESGHMAKALISQGLKLSLEMNNEALNAIRGYCHRTGEPYSLEDNALAQLPRGSVAFPGNFGKIPGCVISSKKQHIVMLPETRDEIIPMFNRYVSPYLGGTATFTITRTVRTYGIREDAVRSMIVPVMQEANPAVAIQREQNEVLIQVSAHAETSQQAAALCTPVLRDIVDKMGDYAYGLDVDSLQSAVVGRLAKKERSIAIAEQGSDGMLARMISETDGGQALLRQAVIVDGVKDMVGQLGVKKRAVKKRGVVSEYAAVAMAAAVREKAGAGIGAAICTVNEETASRKNPLGLVYIAVCDKLHVYVKKLVIGEGDAREDVIIDAALSRALNMIRLFVDYLPGRYTAAIPLREALDGMTVTDRESYDDYVEVEGAAGAEDPEKQEKKAGFKNKLRRVILILAVMVFVGSAGYLGYNAYQSWHNKKMAEELANMFTFGEMGDVEVSPDYPKDYSLKFAGLWNVNRDVRAFINIEGTGVRYPIVQAQDNDYYLRRDFYENSNQHGVPFFDFRVNVEKPSDNMVVYGHNMTDGQIFGEIIQYKELDFYKEHPVIDFSTVFGDDTYKIFSVFITNAYENQGPVFDYYNFIDAESDEQFADFLEQLEHRSILDIPVDVEPGDQLITLSTCTYEFQDARLVVVARKVRRGESDTVDVDAARVNESPLYPDVWYSVFKGATKPAGVDGSFVVGGNASTVRNYAGDDTAPAVATSVTVTSSESAEESSPSSQESVSSRSSSSSSTSSSSSSGEDDDRMSQQASEREASRLEEQRRAEESSRLAAEAASAAEAARQSQLEEEERLAAESAAEQSRLEEERLAAEAAAEQARREAEEAAAASSAADETNDEGSGIEAAAMSVSAGALSVGEVTVVANGSRKTGDAVEIVAGVVQNEVGAGFNTEAIKAQAVASYTYIVQSEQSGSVASVYTSSNVDQKVRDAVSEVLGEAVYYGGSLAFTPYHATSAGQTTSAKAVWGGNYPYLVPVDSAVDQNAPGYKYTTTMTSGEVAQRIESKLGISADGNPSGWFEVLSYTDGGYNGNMAVCGETKSKKTGSTITGRIVRETVLNLRSAKFDISYDASSDKFTFTTYGYGHGVGMSQNGANLFAAQGWSYRDILKHYYPGTTVQ